MVQMDFLSANHVRIVGLCGQVHRAAIFAIAQLSCYAWDHTLRQNVFGHFGVRERCCVILLPSSKFSSTGKELPSSSVQFICDEMR